MKNSHLGKFHQGLILAFDRVVAFIMIILLSPIMAVTAITIACFISPKILFRQTRPGLHGKAFTLYKFRTMQDHVDSQGRLHADELRLTAVGTFIRKWSLDELPQLFNVIKGELALVGPRPLLMEYLPLYEPWQIKRHDVRPGMTGWAQIHGRNTLTWDERFELDNWYVTNRTFLLNLNIMAKTCRHLLKPVGVHQDGHVTMTKFDGKPSRLLVIGAGGHGRVVADTAKATGKWREIVFVDDRYPEINQMLGFPVVGTTEKLEDLKGDVVVAIGDNTARLGWHQKLEQNFDFATIIHPSAVISPSAIIGKGTVIFAQAVVQAQSVVGKSVIINTGAKVDHDTYVGDGSHISPSATLAGLAHVGKLVWVGMHAAILPGVQVGDETVVGAGALVNKDVNSHQVVIGVPAKPMETLV